VVASVSDAEEIAGLTAQLKAEAELLAASDPPREIFVFIDSFEDFSEELESLGGELEREMAGVARRYGRDGLHFILAAGPEFGSSELRRRVAAANLGIGLRTAPAVEAFNVMRLPAPLRGEAELPVGRGYIVRSGQTLMAQVATPFEGMGVTTGEEQEEEDRAALALDAWVERIRARYPDQQAAWQAEGAVEEEAAPAREEGPASVTTYEEAYAAAMSEAAAELPPAPTDGEGRLAQIRKVIRLAQAWETAALADGSLTEPFLDAALGKAGGNGDANALMAVVKEIWRQRKLADGLPADVVESLGSFMDDGSYLFELEFSLPGSDLGA
jgi:hypothetical protein